MRLPKDGGEELMENEGKREREIESAARMSEVLFLWVDKQ